MSVFFRYQAHRGGCRRHPRPARPSFLDSSTACEFGELEATAAHCIRTSFPWPLGKVHGNNNRALIVFGALAPAVRQESDQTVCYWWGISPQTVSKWRKALDVERITPGR